MFKEKMKSALAGFLVGVLLVGSISFAASTGTLYDVLTGGIRIVVDGKELHPTDANGNRVEPFIYNGTTYLPVRAIANATGKAVYWDGPEFTVYLGDMDGELEYPTVKIEDMTSIADSVYKTDMLTDNYGNRYSHAIYNRDYDYDFFRYLLNMKYSRFKGTLYIPKGETDNDTCYLTIVADGKTIYTSPEMNKASRPVDIDVNLRGYNNVAIYYSDYSGWGVPSLCLGNAGFYQ